jgi:hypothetical protein
MLMPCENKLVSEPRQRASMFSGPLVGLAIERSAAEFTTNEGRP